MAIPTQANVSTSADTFNDWITKTNQIATALANTVVTANSTLGVTVGNAYVNGIFSSNTLVATQGLRGGNNSTSNLVTISLGFVSNTSTYVAGKYNSTSTTANQIVDSFLTTAFRTTKYLLQISTSVGYQATEIMLLQDGTNVFITEYATLTNSTSMGTFSANIAAGSVNLLVSPTQTTSAVSFQRISLAV
jgi:hypothetical protein